MKIKYFLVAVFFFLLSGAAFAADSKVTALPAIGSVAGEDLVYCIDDPGGTPVSNKCTMTQIQTFVNTGNAATATALAANGTNCSAGQYARGVDASGNAENCTADADTDTQLSEEQVEDFVGGMLGGTETGITVTYQDTTNDIDFVVSLGTDISPSEMADGDFGDFTFSSSVGTLDSGVVDSTAIADNSIQEVDLKAIDSPSDEECFTYEATGGDFEWQSCGAGAETNDLESVATNAGDGEVFVGTGAGTGAYITGLAACAADEKIEYVPGSPDTFTCEAIGSLVEADISDLSHTATAITDGLIIEPDLDADVVAVDGDYLQYDSTGTNFTWRSAAEVLSDISASANDFDANGDVTITEADISDLSHTTDTNANTACTGTTTYLDGEGNCDDISTVYEVQLDNEAGLYAVLSDVTNFLQTGDALAGDDVTDGTLDTSEIEDGTLNFPDFDFSNTLAGNPALAVDECFLFADTSGGGFICEGSTADTNEQLYRFPDANGADTTEYIVVADDANVSATEAGYLDGVTSAIQTQIDGKEGTLTNEAGLETAVGGANVIVSTEIDASSEIAGIVADETGSGALVFGTSPTLITPLFSGKIDGDAGTVNDDDCTGEQGLFWFDDTDNQWEFCNNNSGTPTTISAGGLNDVVDDTTPQLGGQLDVNGNALGDGTLELLKFTETASAVNEITIKNNSTTNAPEVQATGDDTNIDLKLAGKGTGIPIGMRKYAVRALVASDTDVATDTSVTGDFRLPFTGTIKRVGCYNSTSGTTGTMTVDIHLNGTTIMTTNKITIDSGEKTSETAATAPALTTTAYSADDIVTFDIDGVHTTAAKGLECWMDLELTAGG